MKFVLIVSLSLLIISSFSLSMKEFEKSHYYQKYMSNSREVHKNAVTVLANDMYKIVTASDKKRSTLEAFFDFASIYAMPLAGGYLNMSMYD